MHAHSDYNNQAETMKFGADVEEVLKLTINSLYSNKDIFLRELLSNASDACNKRRYEALDDHSKMPNEGFKITVKLDKDAGTITVSDNGIGMNKEELINNLGCIASSGTKKFANMIESSQNGGALIGQFGVGFYSAFMVAKRITVKTKKAGDAKGYLWESEGIAEYTIQIENDEALEAGTTVILEIKPEVGEFLDKYRLEHIIKTYSDHIEFPIIMIDENDNKNVVNSASALWTRPKNEITEEQYKSFYQDISHSPDKPWLTLHYKAEGVDAEYTCLLYIPSSRPFDLFNPDRKPSIKLYINRVFIAEEGIGLIPSYLRFLKGVIDSSSLPLNISRESLQYNQSVVKIRKSIVNKIITVLKQKAENDSQEYAKFWDTFGEVLKEGLCEAAFEDKERLLDACRFHTTKSGDELISLDQYVDRMIEGQDKIFYINGDNLEVLRHHSQLEGFTKRDIEVILLYHSVDDFWVNVVNQYKNKELCSAAKSDVDLDSVKHLDEANLENAPTDEENSALVKYIKDTLGSLVRDVRVSKKLVDSPSCLAIPEGSFNIRMERLLIAQKQMHGITAKILEVNPNHKMLRKISNDITSGSENQITQDMVRIIFDQACLIAGEEVKDVHSFIRNINQMMQC